MEAPRIITLLDIIGTSEAEFDRLIKGAFGQGYPHDHFARRVTERIREARKEGRTAITLTFQDRGNPDGRLADADERQRQFERLGLTVETDRESTAYREPAPGDWGLSDDRPYVPIPPEPIDVVTMTVRWA